MAEIRHGTLAANTATTVSLSGNYDELLLCNRNGTAEIYYTIDGPTPTVGGNDCLVLPATVGWARIPSQSRASTVVRMIANNPVKYSIRSTDPFGASPVDAAVAAVQQAVTLTSPSAWFRADAIVDAADNGPVAVWPGSVTNGHVATQVLPASQPLYKTGVLNGRPVVRFDGTDDYFRCDTLAAIFTGNDTPCTVTSVSKTAVAGAAVQDIVGVGRSTTATPNLVFRYSTSSGGVYQVGKRDDANIQLQAFSVLTTDTSWHVLSFVVPGVTALMWRDGIQIFTGTALDAGQTTLDQCGIGALVRTAVISNPLNGDIAELLIWNRALSTTDRQSVERALGTKYGITVV